MFTYRSKDLHRDQIVSALLDGELSAAEEQRVRQAAVSEEAVRRRIERYTLVREALHAAAPDRAGPEEISRASERVRAHIDRTIRVRPLDLPWWRTTVTLPVPALSAAAAVVVVLAGFLVFSLGARGGEFTGSQAVAGEQQQPRDFASVAASDRQINVQVNVDGDHTDRLLQWLNEQGHNQQITVQLPEQAQFQLRGDPVLVRRPPRDDTELTIVPLEDEEE